MIHGAATLTAEHAERMGLVHIHRGMVAFCGGIDFGKFCDVAGHAEDAIENHNAPGFIGQALEAVFEGTG